MRAQIDELKAGALSEATWEEGEEGA